MIIVVAGEKSGLPFRAQAVAVRVVGVVHHQIAVTRDVLEAAGEVVAVLEDARNAVDRFDPLRNAAERIALDLHVEDLRAVTVDVCRLGSPSVL